jgi:hypothetical protein
MRRKVDHTRLIYFYMGFRVASLVFLKIVVLISKQMYTE